MTRNLTLLAAITMTAVLPAAALKAADQPSPAELRMRDALKNTMLQLRTAQNDLATAQAAQAESDQKVKDLTDQVDKLTKQAIADKDASDKTIADLNAKNARQAAQIAAYEDALQKWKAGYALAATAAKTKEADRAKLASEKIVLQRRVDDLQTKNEALFAIGNDVLTRYEKFGLGQALAAKEPFVGLTRVKLENQVQDYQDKQLDQKAPTARHSHEITAMKFIHLPFRSFKQRISWGIVPSLVLPVLIAGHCFAEDITTPGSTPAAHLAPLPSVGGSQGGNNSVVTTPGGISASAGDAVMDSSSAGPDVIGRIGDTDIKTVDDIRAVIQTLDPSEQAAMAADPALLKRVVLTLLVEPMVVNEITSKKWDQQPEVQAHLEQSAADHARGHVSQIHL